MLKAKELIENIKNKQINSDKEYVLDSLAGAIDKIQKAFPRYGSFLMEFVQNADDAKSRSLRIEITNNTIRILNNGIPFSEEDVKSICKVGRSSKTPTDYIGYLGVGFKAVFLISECPEIYSGDFRFKFTKDGWDNPVHTPWQVIPLWIETPQEDLSLDYKTIFNIPLKEPTLLEKLREEINPEHLSERILLFLRNVREIDIIDKDQKFSRRIVKSDVSKTSDYEIYQIEEYEKDIQKSLDYWLIFRSFPNVPKDVKEDYITKEWERGNIEKREVLVAFKLDKENYLIREEKGTAHIGVFSFLPLKEIPSGLNFLIQADFLTTPGRGELARECTWNDWLASELAKLVINKAIPVFLRHDSWKMNFTEILYSLAGGHELFEKFIKEPLRHYIETNPVLIAENGTITKAEELVSMKEEIRKLVTNEDLEMLYPGKKIIHNDCKPYSLSKIETIPEDIYEFIRSSKGEELLKHKAELRDLKWFKKLYSMFIDKYTRSYFQKHYYYYNKEHDNFWNRMQDFYKPIMLTEDYSLAKINECFINPKKLKIPEQIKDKIKIIHSELTKDGGFNELRKRLKVIRELTEEYIKNILKEQEALELDEEKWEHLPEDKKIEKIRHLKDLWVSRYLSLEQYHFLTLKSKSGKWIKPKELIFSKEYKAEHNLEIISAEKKLYDAPLEFVSAEFIHNESEDGVAKWSRFFEELGVDKKLEDKNFVKNVVQRIGILTALKYEASHGRISSRELSRSEETGGYDIKQFPEESEEEGEGFIQSEERYIEVKGNKKPNPNILITTKQIKTLQNKREKYFVYVVKDALRYPTLCVTRGDKLLSITDINIIIPFSKWSSAAEEEEYQP